MVRPVAGWRQGFLGIAADPLATFLRHTSGFVLFIYAYEASISDESTV
jgi:hypothetical protein